MSKFTSNSNHKFGYDRRLQVPLHYTLYKNTSVIVEQKPEPVDDIINEPEEIPDSTEEIEQQIENEELESLPVQHFLENKVEEIQQDAEINPEVARVLTKMLIDSRFKLKKVKK